MGTKKIVDAERLNGAMTASADAIRAKTGGTADIPWDMDTGFAGAIGTIPTGGSDPVIQPLSVTANGTYTAPESVDGYSPVTVNVPFSGDADDFEIEEPVYIYFYDYDGTLLYQYTPDEIQEMTELPDAPEHEGLVFQDWNWDLADIKNINHPLYVGALYTTYDGKGRLYITISSEDELEITLTMYQSVTGACSLDFGDGTEPVVLSGTGAITTTHTYSAVGDYVIAVEKLIESATVRFGWHYPSEVKDSAVYPKTILRKVEYGDIHPSVNSFLENFNLTCVVASQHAYSASAYSYCGCTGLKFFVVTNTDPVMGNDAFCNCTALWGVSIPYVKGAYFTKNGKVFDGCTALRAISIDGYTSITQSVFRGCSSLRYVYGTSEVTTIGESAFQDCVKLRKIDLSSCTVVGLTAFSSCKSLGKIELTVCSNIGTNAFVDCYALKKIINKTNVATVHSIFLNCYNLELIDINTNYFYQPTSAYGLKIVILRNSVVTVLNSLVSGGLLANGYGYIFVPANLVNAYKADTNWCVIADQILAIEDYPEITGG